MDIAMLQPFSQLSRAVVRCRAPDASVRVAETRAALPRRASGYSSSELTVRASSSVAERPAPVSSTLDVASQPSGQRSSDLHGSALRGSPAPLGATYLEAEGAINFAVYSSNAHSVELCFFTEADLRTGKVTHAIELDPGLNKSGDIWHIQIPGLGEDLLYGYRLHGKFQGRDKQGQGHRFKSEAVVLDPYARAIISRRKYGEHGADLDYGRDEVLGLATTWPQGACSLPGPSSTFDWEGDQPLNLPMEDLVIYEMHVRGFTWDSSSRTSSPGTYAGLIEKLDYLQRLGVNAIELLPIHEFNELEYYQLIPGTKDYRFNYWGYSTVGFFAPMARFSQAALEGAPGSAIVDEFKALVKACHSRGIEVILDVVFNHTAEGNEQGPTISFRGLDNRVYYMLAPEGQYYNYSGCGNTFNCNHPQVRQFIVDCLRYWVLEMHVDGFRFDLASIMTRAHSVWQQPGDRTATKPQKLDPPAPKATTRPGANGATAAAATPPPPPPVSDSEFVENGAGVPVGTPLSDPALVEMISDDPVLRNTKLIAEAWDCDGLNQVGAFPHFGGRWAEWNGRFRDTVRQFVKGTEGPWAAEFASAVCGSPRIYASPAPEDDWWGSGDGNKWRGGRGPRHSVNFITAHDGFTLADLVAFNQKHNDANGEQNRDGESHNLTWNCGAEGPTDEVRVQRLRARQQRNMAAALLLSQGVPMILMGDEYGHSKGGNNNTYCHDSPLNWFNWSQAEEDSTGFARFFRLLVNLRRRRPELRQPNYLGAGQVQWHGTRAGQPDWSDTSRLVAYSLSGPTGGLYVAFNSHHLPTTLQLPDWHGMQWRLLLDTGKVAPLDFLEADEALSQEVLEGVHKDAHMWTAENLYYLLPWSCCVLEAIPWDDAPTFGPYSTVLEPVTLAKPAPLKGTKKTAARAA